MLSLHLGKEIKEGRSIRVHGSSVDIALLLLSIVIGALIMLVLVSGIKVIALHERGVYFRMRRFVRILDPGFWFVAPLVSDVYRMDMRERTPTPYLAWNDVVTADGVNLQAILKASYKIIDPEKAFFGNPSHTLSAGLLNVYQDKLWEVVGEALHDTVRSMDADDVQSRPERVAESVEWSVQSEVDRIGLKITKLVLEFGPASHSRPVLPWPLTLSRVDRTRPRKVTASKKNL